VVGVLLASSANSDTDEVQKELDATQDDLDQAQDDLDSAQSDLEAAHSERDSAQSDLATAQSDLATVQSERDAAQSSADALRGLFPVGFASFANAPLAGDYVLTYVEGSGICTGYADNNSACSAANLPGDLTITGDSGAGYQVSSGFFAPVPLVPDGSRFTAAGAIDDAVADLCDGSVVPTTFTLVVSVAEVGLTADDVPTPTLLFVDFTMNADSGGSCTATSRDVDLDGTPL